MTMRSTETTTVFCIRSLTTKPLRSFLSPLLFMFSLSANPLPRCERPFAQDRFDTGKVPLGRLERHGIFQPAGRLLEFQLTDLLAQRVALLSQIFGAHLTQLLSFHELHLCVPP